MGKKFVKFVSILALLLTFATYAPSAGFAASSDAPEILISTYSVGAVWYLLGGGILDACTKENVNAKITYVEGSGGVANVMGCNTGLFQMGLVWSPTLPLAFAGKEPFKEPMDNVRIVCAFYDGCLQYAVDAKSDIVTYADLKGKRVAPASKGADSEVIFRIILGLYGMTYDDLALVDHSGIGDALNLLADGHLDMAGTTLPVPSGTITEADSRRSVRIVKLDDDKFPKLAEINSAYGRRTVPAHTYSGMETDVDTVSYPLMLVANKDVPEQAVYEVLKACFAQKANLELLTNELKVFTPEYACRPDLGPLHPGAIRYYREAGVLK